MANIVGCEVISLESYYKSEQVKDFKYDDFNSLDLSLLSKVWRWMLTLFYSLSWYVVINTDFDAFDSLIMWVFVMLSQTNDNYLIPSLCVGFMYST